MNNNRMNKKKIFLEGSDMPAPHTTPHEKQGLKRLDNNKTS